MVDRLDVIRRLIVAFRTRDEVEFRGAAEAVVRELTTANRHSEAKTLRELLSVKTEDTPRAESLKSLPPIRRAGEEFLIRSLRRVRRDEVFLCPETAIAIDRVLLEVRQRHLLAEHGLQPKSKLLFWGPPGCGKTYSAQMIATEL